MKNEMYPGCCGIRVLHNFGGTVCTNGDVTAVTKKDFKEFLAKAKRMSNLRAFLTLALNGTQENKFGETARDEGFKLVDVGRNIPHKTLIYLYVHKLNGEED